MPYEYSAGAVIFYQSAKTIEYLLLQYRHKRWDFPHGHIEPGESDKETARREIKEETGISKIKFMLNFKEKVEWFYKRQGEPKSRHKEVVYFLAQSPSKKVRLNFENLNFKCLAYKEALALPAFPHVKKVLQKAHDYLTLHKKT